MDKDIIRILGIISEVVGFLNNGYNKVTYINKKNQIQHIYESMSLKKKYELIYFINKEFSQDINWYILLTSLLVKSTHDIKFLSQIINIVINNELNPYMGTELEYQAAYETFTNDYNQEEMYNLLRKLHTFNVDNFKSLLDNSFEYIPYIKRNSNRIVIITDQILNINHAPTKIILEQCYTLQKEMGLEIFLIVSPINVTLLNNTIWSEIISENYFKELNGDYIVTYEGSGIYIKEKQCNGIFVINYKDTLIKGKQILFDQDNYMLQKQVFKEIYEFNPKFVYNINSINPLADLCKSFTTVVACGMSYGYPVSDAPILLCLDNKNIDEVPKNEVLLPYQQYIIKYKSQYIIEKPKYIHNRKEFGIPEDNFVITIVGNRLQDEITPDFIMILKHLLDINLSISILLIGNYNNYYEYFNNNTFQNRVYCIGYQTDLVSVISIADLYLNPPRKGGGTSALIALYAGVPVITFPNCDVAGNVGENYICNNEEELFNLIDKYLNNREFYNYQKEYGIRYTHQLLDSTANLTKTIKRIEEIVQKGERSNTDDD
jgi:hypothetical protein